MDGTAEREFDEIGLAHAKLRLLRSNDGAVSLELTSTGGSSALQIGVSLDGRRMEWWPFTGVDMRPQCESPMIPVILVSDRQLFYGRTCPACHGYFRTRNIAATLYCPYCSVGAALIDFTTANQHKFIDEVRTRFIKALAGNTVDEIDFDAVAQALPDNRPAWAYSEERQQHRFTCVKCQNCYDILGEYGCCPRCGARNSLQVLMSHLEALQVRFESMNATVTERAEREVEWERMTLCISEFEAMARDIQARLAHLPLTPTRRQDVQQISFYRIPKADDLLRRFFAIELLKDVTDTDKQFLNTMFNRRHLFTHNAGRVDEDYLKHTGDSGVRLHQRLTVRSREIARLIPLLTRIATNLFAGFESISAQ